MSKPCYTHAVDNHIYNPCLDLDKASCQTPEDWLQLAIAALDQAGMSARDQDRCEAFIRGMPLKEVTND